jgi:Tol biopolymer transport system component
MIEQQTPTEPALDPRAPQERRAVRNRRLGGVALVVVLIAVAVFAAISLRDGDEGTGSTTDTVSSSGFTPIEVITNSYLDITTGETTPAEVHLPGANLPEVSPNGESVVYFTFDSDGIFVAPIDGSEEATITLDGLSAVAPTWIDDVTILFQGRPLDGGANEIGDLYTLDVPTGDVTMVTDLPVEKHGAWFIVSDVSPDGSTVLFHLPRGNGQRFGYDLWTAPIAGGEATLLRRDAGYAQYGPDGSIVFLASPGLGESDAIWVMDSDGRHARSLVEGGPFSSGPRFSPDGATVAYANDEMLEVVDVVSGEVTQLDASTHEADPAWYDATTLIVD